MMEAMKVRKRVREHPFYREQAKKKVFYDLSAIFARKLQKSHLKMGWISIWELFSLFI